jgi:hypothetical protein
MEPENDQCRYKDNHRFLPSLHSEGAYKMKRSSAIMIAAGLFIALMILAACQISTPPEPPTPTPHQTPISTEPPTPAPHQTPTPTEPPTPTPKSATVRPIPPHRPKLNLTVTPGDIITPAITISTTISNIFATRTPVPSPLDDKTLDVAKAIFRHLTAYNDASPIAGPMVYLTLFGEDPPPEFLSRFADGGKRIRGGSEFVIGTGLKFFIEDIEWISEDMVEVTAGYYEAPLSAAGYAYTMERQDDGRWVVIDKRMKWIS